MKYLTLIMLIPFAKLAADDFRRREVSVVWLAVTAVCAVGVAVAQEGWREMLVRSGLNLLIIAYLAIGVAVWAWIKARRPVNPVNRFIGLGDVLFFVALVPLFPFKRFAWLLVVCMVFSLVWWWVVQAIKRPSGNPPKNIPLVATSAIVVGAAIIFNTFF